MQILAIFDSPEAEATIQLLRKNKHVVTVLDDNSRVLEVLSRTTFDLILCQASFESDSTHVFDILKNVRKISDIPLLCCNSSNLKLENTLDNVFVTTLPLLGGQGYIDRKSFFSPRFVQIVEKALHCAVGRECRVSSVYAR